ncbi:MAG TPA: hypothetical protein VLZ03_01770, partial [Thermodesulfobacteriota bacterium]|nr:hypothetical protein [Thermodesulfobacteriota bacterium]
EDVTAPADFGYAAKISMALAGGGARLVRGTEDITDVFEEKLRVLSIFASQFKLSYMEPRIRKFGEHEGGTAGKFAEPYYRVEGEPCLPLESQLFRKDPASLQTDIHRLLPKMTKYRRLTVMALPSGRIGTWKANKESLMAAFPNIDLRGYVSEKTAWQAEEGGKDKLRLQVVRGRWRGWGGVILRNLFRFQTPTLILWYGAYGTSIRRRLIKWMLPFRYVLFSATLCDFICILNEQLGNIDKGFGL